MPLLFLIPLVIVATGIVGVRSGFFKFLAPPSPSSLPQYISQFQQDPMPTTTPVPTIKLVGEVQTKPFVYKEKAVNPKMNTPSFTVSAPSGWVKTNPSRNELVRFESPEVDTEQVDEGELTTNAIINIKSTDSYQGLDDFVDQYKASGSGVSGYRLVGLSTVGNGRSLEVLYATTIEEKEIIVHELAYLFFRDGVSVLVKGYAADSAWGEHAGKIRSSLNSFRFN